jgi:hypothetical protein
MPANTADIVGTNGASFVLTTSSGEVLSAYLEVVNQPNVSLAIDGTQRAVTVPSLPAGDSTLRLDLAWAPGDPNATIGVNPTKPGTVAAAHPNLRLDDGDTPGYFTLFGA